MNPFYAGAFALLGGMLAASAVRGGGWGWWLLWPSLSLLLLATGYAGVGARVLGKRPSGTLATWAKILHSPNLIYASLVWNLVRLASREPPISRVDDRLFLARRLTSAEMREDVAHIIDLTAEVDEPAGLRNHPGYICMPILDAGIPDAEAMKRVIERVRSNSVLVHCAMGHGRTGLFALLLLAHRGQAESVAEGLAILSRSRPGIGLNRAQEQFAYEYLRTFRLKKSVEQNLPVDGGRE